MLSFGYLMFDLLNVGYVDVWLCWVLVMLGVGYLVFWIVWVVCILSFGYAESWVC